MKFEMAGFDRIEEAGWDGTLRDGKGKVRYVTLYPGERVIIEAPKGTVDLREIVICPACGQHGCMHRYVCDGDSHVCFHCGHIGFMPTPEEVEAEKKQGDRLTAMMKATDAVWAAFKEVYPDFDDIKVSDEERAAMWANMEGPLDEFIDRDRS